MRKLTAFCGLALMLLAPFLASAQAPEMDSVMTRNGKIYVVVAVLAVILVGVILYLVSMERRLKKLEGK